jgi:hypothetical protein
MTSTYAKETNRYGRNLTPTDAVVYDRAGYLTAEAGFLLCLDAGRLLARGAVRAIV